MKMCGAPLLVLALRTACSREMTGLSMYAFVLGGHEFSFGSILGSAADGEGRVQGQIKLAHLERVVSLDVPEDDAEGYRVSDASRLVVQRGCLTIGHGGGAGVSTSNRRPEAEVGSADVEGRGVEGEKVRMVRQAGCQQLAGLGRGRFVLWLGKRSGGKKCTSRVW